MNENKGHGFPDVIQQAIDAFAAALGKDFDECMKQVGVLELCRFPEVEFFVGLAFHGNKDFTKAIEHFIRVAPSSRFYPDALVNLAYDYSCTGAYEKLCEVLEQSEFVCSPMAKLHHQIVCLEHIDANEFSSLHEVVKKRAVVVVPADRYVGEDAELFFGICRMFSDALVLAGECMNQCIRYQINNNLPVEAFQPNSDMSRFISEYEKWCTILSLSSRLDVIVISNNHPSLANCALYDKPWGEKLTIFQSSDYIKQIINIILTLTRPELHQSIPPYDCVVRFLEALLHVHPRSILKTVDYYFDVISEAYLRGEGTAAQYIGYAYAEILAEGKDPYNLKDRIDSIRKQDDGFDIEETVKSIRLTRTMSQKGHEALMNALSSFAKASETVPGAHDFSTLSLQIFRVIEIEYSEKLLLPLAKQIEIQQLSDLAKKDDEKRDPNKRIWPRDCELLESIKLGKKPSIPVGAIRTLLGHMVWSVSKDDAAAQYLYSIVEKLLTEKGVSALKSKDMLNVIDGATIDKYRSPGAHTGYLPYSVACQAKEYVTRWLPIIEGWFISG